MSSKILGAVLGSLFILVGCQKSETVSPVSVKEVEKPVTEAAPVKPEAAPVEAVAPSTAPDLERGRKVWITTCNQCHNKDPNVKGAIGPEVVDAPLEVMLAKVKTGKYPDPLPPGFVPKRKTKAMRPLPQHEKDVPSIWAYVQSVKKNKAQ